MRAAIYNGQKNVPICQLADPVCGDNDIIVKNLYASICGTDVAVYNHGPNTGQKITVGGEFGHEVVSQVVEAGKNVKDITVGDIVYPYHCWQKAIPAVPGRSAVFPNIFCFRLCTEPPGLQDQ